MFALISTEELEEAGQIMIKQLKNRYNDTYQNRKFIVGVNRSKMKLFDVAVDESAIPQKKKPDDFFGTNKPNSKNIDVSNWNF